MRRAAVGLACLLAVFLGVGQTASAVDLPSGFQESTVIDGLIEPTNFRFAPNGKVFVTEKAGKVLVYDDVDDPTPTVFADLRTEVFNAYDRGLLGLAVHPEFPTKPYVYVLYTYDHALGEVADPPKWGAPDTDNDECPDPPGADTNGCVVSARLSRLTADGDQMSEEQVIVEDWCQQFSTHSIGDLQFDSDGALYASAGDGAGFLYADYGQAGDPTNPCGDPPAGVGGTQEPPTAEGGALRAQDVLTPADPTGLSGTVIRIDPETGEGMPGNPFGGSADANSRRIIAFGFRNPFRFTIDSETHEIYLANVGWNTYEEIDRFNAVPSQAYNSGWPCFEGPEHQFEYEIAGLDVCQGLYDTPGSTSAPFFHYTHADKVVPGDPCPDVEGSSVAGLTVYRDDAFPDAYDGALFLSDPVRGCIWVMFPGEDGRPDPATIMPFMTDGGLYPGIELQVGPEGDLYFVSLFGEEEFEYEPGGIHRISHFSGNQPPVARLGVDNQSGPLPLEVEFDASGSSDADGDELSFEWDFDDDGSFEVVGSNDKMTSETYNDTENHTVAVRVSDPDGASSVDRVTVYPGDTPPEPEISLPPSSFKWSVGQQVAFEGSATDAEDGGLPATRLDWSARIAHCPDIANPTACHTHQLPAFPAVASGSFAAPDHDYPSHIRLTLKATDSRGLSKTKTVSIDPQTVELLFQSSPPGLSLSAGFFNKAAPFSLTAIKGGSLSVTAPLTQTLGGKTYVWDHWSGGLSRTDTITASEDATYEAVYTAQGEEPDAEEPSDGAGGGGSSGGGNVIVTPPLLIPPANPKASPRLRAVLRRHPPKRTRRRTAKFTFFASVRGTRFLCKLDRTRPKLCRSPQRYRRLRPGVHVFRLIAINGGERARRTFRWKVVKRRMRRHFSGPHRRRARAGATPRPAR